MQKYMFGYIDDEQTAKSTSDEIFKTLTDLGSGNEKTQKEWINQLYQKIHENIDSPASSPRSKYMSILILRDIIEESQKPETKIRMVPSALLAHKLLGNLEEKCMRIDPYKPIQDKGKTLFPGDSDTGYHFITCILQIVRYLAERYPKHNKSDEPTAFKKTYTKLISSKVNFPSDYKFMTMQVPLKNRQKDDYGSGQISRERKPSNLSSDRGGVKQSDFKFLCSKIVIFLRMLQQQDEEQYLMSQISKMHEMIKMDVGKYDNKIIELADSGANQELVNRYLDVTGFLHQEIQLYDKYVDRSKEYKTYIAETKAVGFRVFPKQSGNSTPGFNPPQQSGNIIKTNSKQSNTFGNRIKEQEEKPVKTSAFNPNTLNNISRFFEHVEEKSKSPISGGFKKIGESLSREKAKNIPKSGLSPLNRTNFSRSINSLKESKIAAVFTNPPNQNPPPRHYQGREISENYSIQDTLMRINKRQGHRRFCTANFKGKSSLFENEHIQIGHKSEAIYEEVSGFRVLLKMEIFFGNLSEDIIRNLTLEFKGDQNILLYANPKEIEKSVMKGEQNKIQLVIIPLKPQFPLLTMNVRYEIGGTENEYMLILPNSALKFAHFMEITKSEFSSRWGSAELYKTSEFFLSHHLPPDSLVRWIPSLVELTTYSAFVVPNGKKDYELYAFLVMMQKYEALLKINIRPNLKVVLQLGVEEKNEESMGYFTTFLQHLQQFMKDNK